MRQKYFWLLPVIFWTLVVGLSSGMLWQADEQMNELEDVDSALLADDLPLDAYTDQGFAAWLDQNPDE